MKSILNPGGIRKGDFVKFALNLYISNSVFEVHSVKNGMVNLIFLGVIFKNYSIKEFKIRKVDKKTVAKVGEEIFVIKK